MKRTIKSVFVVVLAAGLALVSVAPASAFGGATTNAGGCCRYSGTN